MSRYVVIRSLRYSALLVTIGCSCPQIANAGKEILSVQCGSPQLYDSTTMTYIVPVTVTLENGQPDTIDMSYSGTDGAMPPVAATCSPASDKLYVTKDNPVVDNVMVTYTGSATVTFTAYGDGENGGDSDSSQISLTFPGPTAPATATVTYGTISTRTKYAVPLTLALQPAGSPDQLNLTYTASDATSTMLKCHPASETRVVVQAGMPATHQVFVDYTGSTAPVTFSLSAVSAIGTTNQINYSHALPISAPAATSQSGNVSLSLGPTSSFSFLRVPVNITISGTTPVAAKVRFWALDNNGTPYGCHPLRKQFSASSTATTINVDVVTNGAPHVTLYCRGVGLDQRTLSIFRSNDVAAP